MVKIEESCEQRVRVALIQRLDQRANERQKRGRADTDPHRVEHTSTHSVVHCGLGVGLTAGECCAERIGEQGNDLGLERIGNGVVAKPVVRSASNISNDVLSAQDKKSQRKHHPFFSSKQVTRSIQSHIPASLKLCKRLVELQRGEQLPRACLADVVATKGATKAATGKCEH